MVVGRVSSYRMAGSTWQQVTRAEFVKMVNGIIDYNKPNDITFKDIPATAWL